MLVDEERNRILGRLLNDSLEGVMNTANQAELEGVQCGELSKLY